MYNSWERINPYPPPFSFTREELEQRQQNYKEWASGERGRKGLEEKIGIRHDGWVPTDEYDEAKRRNEDMRKAFINTAPLGYEEEYDKGWPFQSNSSF